MLFSPVASVTSSMVVLLELYKAGNNYSEDSDYGDDLSRNTVQQKDESKEDDDSVLKWFNEEVGYGENAIIIYPNLQKFRQIYTKYVKDQLVKEDSSNDEYNKENKQLRRRIILVAPFYETVDSVKQHLVL